MKTNSFIIILLLNVSILKGQDLIFGFRAGISFPYFSLINNVHNNDKFKASSLNYESYSVNGIIKLRYSESWGLSLEPGFSKKGGGVVLKYRRDNINTAGEIYCASLYSNIEVPLLLNYKLSKRVEIMSGLSLEYILSTEQRMPILLYIPERDLLPTLENKLHGSAIVGLNYKFNNYYSMSLLHSFGITKIAEKDIISDTNYPFPYIPKNTKIYMNALQLSFMYTINDN